MSIDRYQVRRTMKLRRGMVDSASQQLDMQAKAISQINEQERLGWYNHRLSERNYAVNVRVAEALEAILAIAKAEHAAKPLDLSKVEPGWFGPAGTPRTY